MIKSKQNPEAMNASHYKIEIPEMCSSLHYFIVFPYSHNEIGQHQHKNQSFMLTYSNQNIKFEELIQQYQSKMPSLKNFGIQFQLSKGYLIDSEWSTKALKKALNRNNIDGLALFLKLSNKNSTYLEQCCVANYIHQQVEWIKNPQNCKIFFSLPSNNQVVISVITNNQESSSEVLNKFIKETKLQLGQTIYQNSISEYRVKNKGSLKIQSQKFFQNEVFADDVIEVIFKDKNVKFGNILSQKRNKELAIIYKPPQGEQVQKKLNYEHIKNMQFSHICKQYFGFKQNDFCQQNQTCLRIMDLIIKPNDTLCEARRYFPQTNLTDFITIVGHIVSQRKVFNNVITELSKKNISISFKDIQPVPQKRKSIQKKLKERQVRLKDDKHIKSLQNLQPIFIYSSEARAQNQQSSIYCSVNTHLRNNSILNVDVNSKQFEEEWKYKYITSLIGSLNKISSTPQKIVYRGVNYRPPEKLGEIVTFKSFLSTSTNEDMAKNIAKGNNKLANPQFSLFVLKIADGKSISSYAQFQQNEIVLLPFTQFKINKILKKGQFHYYQMEEVGDRNETLQEMKGNFLLWIDDKTYQGKIIYQQISKVQQPLVFKQFLSTQQFSNWLNANQALLKDPTANILVISNMKRVQNGVENPIAGIQSLKKLREFTQSIPVIFYVGYIPATKEHLRNHNLLNCGMKIQICNDKEELQANIKKYMQKMSFISDLVKSSVSHTTSSQIQPDNSSICEIY